MVRRRDEHCGDGLVLENHAQVLDCLRLGTLLGDEARGDFRRAIAIRVADVGDLAVREAGQFLGVLLAANAAAEDGHGDFVIGADGPLFRRARRRGNRRGDRRGCSQNGIFEKLTARDV